MLFILILILSLIACFITPWWAIAIICFVMSMYAGKKPAQAFWSGFVGIFIAWLVFCLVKSIPNNHIMASKMAALFSLPHWSLLLLATAVMGGLVGGMSSLSGLLLRRLLVR